MKKLIIVLVANFMAMNFAFSQGTSINTTGAPADPSAMLDVSGTNGGVLINRMTTTERNNIVSPAKGLLIYNLDCDNFCYNAGTPSSPNWLPMTPGLNIPGAAGNISGTSSVCQGQNNVSFTVPAIANATSYTWTYSGTGATITGSTNTVNIDFAFNATSGDLSVSGTSACGVGAVSANFAISIVSPLAAPSAGTNTPSATQIVWNWNTVSGATGYQWNTTNIYPGAGNNVVSSPSYTQTGLTCNTGYSLYIWAYNACFNSSVTTLTQSTSPCCGIISLDATNEVTESGSSNTFTINTTSANEIILVTVNNNCATTCSNVTVTGAGSVSQVSSTPNGSMNGMSITLYACVPNTIGSHTITVTWGTNNGIAYAASFIGFCGVPTEAANVQATSGTTTTLTSNLSLTIAPATANSCIFGDYWNFPNSNAGTVTWTNATWIRTDNINCPGCFDASIANAQVAGTSAVTVTADDSALSYSAYRVLMVLAVVHP